MSYDVTEYLFKEFIIKSRKIEKFSCHLIAYKNIMIHIMVIIFFLKNTTIYNIIILCCILLYLYSYHKITIFKCIKFFLNLLTTTFQCSLSFFKYDTVLITFSFAQIERSNFNLLQFYWLLKLIESTPPIIRHAPILSSNKNISPYILSTLPLQRNL